MTTIITKTEESLVEEFRKHCSQNYGGPVPWDYINECHDCDEIVEKFIRPSKCKTLSEIISCKEVKTYLKYTSVGIENTRWDQ